MAARVPLLNVSVYEINCFYESNILKITSIKKL